MKIVVETKDTAFTKDVIELYERIFNICIENPYRNDVVENVRVE